MATWTISKKLNVSPYAAPLVIQIKQYTSDFALKLQLYSTVGDLDIPAGATTKIRGTKRDGNGYELTGTRIGHTCTFSGTKAQMQQMTAAHGRCVFEVVVEHDGKELITANFYLEVQRAAMDAGTVTSESIIEEFADFQSKITAAQAAATAAQAQADRAEAAAESIDFGLDATPTQGSSNAVSSGGVWSALSEVQNKLSDITTTEDISQNIDQSAITRIPDKKLNAYGGLIDSTNGHSVLWFEVPADGTYTINSTSSSQFGGWVYSALPISSANAISNATKLTNTQIVMEASAGQYIAVMAWSADFTIEASYTAGTKTVLKSTLPLTDAQDEQVKAYIADLQGDIEESDASIDAIIDRTPMAETLTLVNNEYVNTSGAFVPYNNWSRTDYIEVIPNSTVTFNTSESLTYNFSYDENKNPVGSKWSIPSGESTKTLGDNISYIVLSGKTTSMNTLQVFAGQESINLKSTLPLTTEMESQVDKKFIIPDQVVNPTAYLMKGQIPNYYFARNESALTKHDIGYLDDKINSIPEGYHFMFVTDTHWNDNAGQSGKIISYVRDRIGAKIVLFGGDILTAHSTDAIAYRWLCDFVFEFKNLFGSNFLPVVGNHDLNGATAGDPQLLYSDLVPVYTQGCDARFHYCDFYDNKIDAMQTAKGMTDEQVSRLKQYFRTCYYVDDVEGKARYIIYNTGAGDGGSGITEFIDSYITGSFEELLVIEWMYEVLMHTPTGYNVILCTHIPGDFSWSTGGTSILSSVRQKFAACIAGMKAKQVVTVYMPNNITDYSWWGGNTLTFDYRNAPDIGLLLVMGGHTHVDTFGKYGFSSGYTSSNVPNIQSDINATAYTVKQSSTTYEDGTYKYEVPIILSQHDAYIRNSGPYSHAMQLGTVTEQVIDVVTITPSGDVALTRIGAGNDRYLTIE